MCHWEKKESKNYNIYIYLLKIIKLSYIWNKSRKV